MSDAVSEDATGQPRVDNDIMHCCQRGKPRARSSEHLYILTSISHTRLSPPPPPPPPGLYRNGDPLCSLLRRSPGHTQALTCLLYQLLAAVALAMRTRFLMVLIAADEWSGGDGSKGHSKPKRCRLSPPPHDGEQSAPSSWWRRASLLPPQAPHLAGKLTVSFTLTVRQERCGRPQNTAAAVKWCCLLICVSC